MSAQLRLLLVIGASAAIALLLVAGLGRGSTAQLLDPDGPVKELALRDAAAAAQLNEDQVWQGYSPCRQARDPKDAWVRARDSGGGGRGGGRARGGQGVSTGESRSGSQPAAISRWTTRSTNASGRASG